MNNIDYKPEGELNPSGPNETEQPIENTPEQAPEESQNETQEQAGPTVEELQAQLEEAQNEAAKFKRMAERRASKKSTAKDSTSKSNTDELDYGMKAYLKSEGIDSSEFGFVESQMQESGLPLEQLLSNGYFKSQLQEFRDKKSVAQATPGTSRGTQASPKNEVEYWLGRGEMPPNTPENVELRRKVVNARYERSKRPHFNPNPVIDS